MESGVKEKSFVVLLLLVCCLGVLIWSNQKAETAGIKMMPDDQGRALGKCISKAADRISAAPYTIEDFEVIYQLPQLPTGCEVTSLAMVLQYYGYDVSKTTLAAYYLPTARYRLTYKNGKAYGPDLDAVFVGNPFGDGTICGPEAIATTANSYLADYFAALGKIAPVEMEARDITGTTPAGLYLRVSNGQPVMIYVTIGMAKRDDTLGWYTESGKYVDWSLNDHGSVLIGWDEESVTVACPLSGIQTISRKQFEKIYAERGYKAAVLE